MFTGIVEALGTIREVITSGSNVDFVIESPFTGELKIDQSVAHNGVCLTVVDISGSTYRVTAVAETLAKTNLGRWKTGDKVNLERSLRVGDRLDGHFVQGHVDATAECTAIETLEGSWLFRFRFADEFASLVVEKGSICLNGVSLTVFNVTDTELTVTIIPYTYEHTNFHAIQPGDVINVEFDILGKYFLRNQTVQKAII
ncbi:riboflavin synthase [Polluticoccus soli]|uniref:riboflavin synthase n=1 Tax=Polluticoccus soli TaxID=3034150 RepID=UPI0023E0DDA3|nr:riboflavin synthase [Flavipsychrobacter sp. JY13-12]